LLLALLLKRHQSNVFRHKPYTLVTRWVFENVAQNVAQPPFDKIYTLHIILWEKDDKNLATSVIKNAPKFAQSGHPVGVDSN
jgi:hypothetical protein